MKWIRVVFIIGSIILLFLIAYAVFNSLVSYKYEIKEPPILAKIDIELAEGYLKSKITWLWCFWGYVAINVIILFSMFRKKK